MASSDDFIESPSVQDPGYVQKAFSSIADRYVLTNHVLSFGTDIWWRRTVAKSVAGTEPRMLLDLATGSGDLAAALRKRLPGSTIIGVDFCQPMLRHAHRRGLPNLIVADGLRLPFDDATFDAVTIAFGLRNMASWTGAAQEIRRVLRPGGRLAILEFSLPNRTIIRRPYLCYLRRILPWVAGKLTGQREAYNYLADTITTFPSGEALCQLLASCGYAECRARALSCGVATLYTGIR